MNDLAAHGWTPELARDFGALEAQGAVPGRIRTQNRLYYFAITEEADLPAQPSGRLRQAGFLPVVGDWVALRPPAPGGSMALIDAVLPRRTALARAMGGLTRNGVPAAQQIIAANADLVLVVAGADADPHPSRLEHFLAAAESSGAETALVLTKIDLVDSLAPLLAGLPEMPVFPISNRTGEGLAALRAAIAPGRTAVLLGSSGAGKSSLVNRLRGNDAQATRPTDAQGHGRHTTTSRDLFLLEGGGLLMDTPGIGGGKGRSGGAAP